MTAMRDGTRAPQSHEMLPPQRSAHGLPPVPPPRGHGRSSEQDIQQSVESIFAEVSSQNGDIPYEVSPGYVSDYGIEPHVGFGAGLPRVSSYDAPQQTASRSKGPSQALAEIVPHTLFHNGSGSTAFGEQDSARTLKTPEESSLKEITSHLRALIESYQQTKGFNQERRDKHQTRIEAFLEVMAERRATLAGKVQEVSAHFDGLREVAQRQLARIQQDKAQAIRAEEAATVQTESSAPVSFEALRQDKETRKQAALIRDRDLRRLNINIERSWARIKQSYDGQEGITKMQYLPDLESVEEEIRQAQELLDELRIEYRTAENDARSTFIKESARWFDALRRRDPRHALLMHDPRREYDEPRAISSRDPRDRGSKPARNGRQRRDEPQPRSQSRGGKAPARGELERGRDARPSRPVREQGAQRPGQDGREKTAARPAQRPRDKNSLVEFAKRKPKAAKRIALWGTASVLGLVVYGNMTDGPESSNGTGPDSYVNAAYHDAIATVIEKQDVVQQTLDNEKVAANTADGAFNMMNGKYFVEDPSDDVDPSNPNLQHEYTNVLNAIMTVSLAEDIETANSPDKAYTPDIIPIDRELGAKIAADLGIKNFDPSGGNDTETVVAVAAELFNVYAHPLIYDEQNADRQAAYQTDATAFYEDIAKQYGITDPEIVKAVVDLSLDYGKGIEQSTVAKENGLVG